MDMNEIKAKLVVLGKNELFQLIDDATVPDDVADIVIQLYSTDELEEIVSEESFSLNDQV